MMEVRWTSKGLDDLVRLHEFLAPANAAAAAKVVQRLSATAGGLSRHPRIGEQLEQYLPREVRRIIVAQYEIRYEVAAQSIYVLRLWHTREDR